jgi:hypothetical protein
MWMGDALRGLKRAEKSFAFVIDCLSICRADTFGEKRRRSTYPRTDLILALSFNAQGLQSGHFA